jgi:tRNA A-37 threonylcarbamoyl transferase component Bud32
MINEQLEIEIDNIITKKKYIEIDDEITNKLGGNEGQMKREVTSLLKLYKKKHFPILLSKSNSDKYIYMNYCGIPLDNDNIPINWKKQILEIIKILKKCNVSNNDMWKNNFLVNNNIIHLVDFGWATDENFFPYINITNYDIKKIDNIFELLDHVYERVVEQRILFRNKLLKK